MAYLDYDLEVEKKSTLAPCAGSSEEEKRFIEWWQRCHEAVLAAADDSPLWSQRRFARAVWAAAIKYGTGFAH